MFFQLLKYPSGEMMLQTKATICARDCYANCGLLVSVENGRAVGLRGDPAHPYNRGMLCAKSRQFIDLLYSPHRIRTPQLKCEGEFVPLSWDLALDLLCERLTQAKRESGPTAVLHYSDYAHSGCLHNNVSKRFFRAFGGCTRPVGSLCMSAGVAALQAACGRLVSKDFTDLAAAGSILLWGANPAVTNSPFLQYLQAAKRAGAKLYLIDPIRTETAAIADEYLRVRPGSDIELALAVARIWLEADLVDREYIRTSTEGFADFEQLALAVDRETAERATGLSWEMITSFALSMAERGPISAILGFGLQRRTSGAQTIWAIASLCALNGSLDRPGAGVYYAHENWRVLGDISGTHEFEYTERTIKRGAAGSELLALGSGIRVAVINQANPLVQNPAPDLFAKALAEIPFVVVIDQFMTPTAQAADLVLPATSFFEDEDLIYNSWHRYLALSEPVVEPVGESRPDPDIFLDLAGRLGLFSVTREELLNRVIAPLAPYGVTLETLRSGPWYYDPATRIERFHFWTGRERSFSYRPSEAAAPAEFPYVLLTVQPRQATHSQGLAAQAGGPVIFYLHPHTAKNNGIEPGREIYVRTARAEVPGTCVIDERVHPEVVLAYNGLWPAAPGLGLNALISEKISTAGDQAALYDCYCAIKGGKSGV